MEWPDLLVDRAETPHGGLSRGTSVCKRQKAAQAWCKAATAPGSGVVWSAGRRRAETACQATD